MAKTPEEFVAEVDQWDIEPPDEDYSPIEHAQSFAASMAIPVVRHAADLAIKNLFSNLAGSVLDGLFAGRPEAFSIADTIGWL